MTSAHWLNEAELMQIIKRNPSTDWGLDLMRDAWPRRFPTVLSSPTYQAYSSVLSRLLGSMRNGMTLTDIERLIEREDQICKTLQPGTAFTGGAGLAVVNAWQDAHAIDVNLFAAKLESELIYTARVFARALQLEHAGRKLA
jgi:hypothetical protein